MPLSGTQPPSGSFWKYLRLKPRPPGSPSPGEPGSSLRDRILKAASWSLLGHFFRQFIRFGSNLILTRLLVPEAFGIMAIATVLLFGFQLFTDIGLKQNIVQSQRGDEREFLNTVWTVQIIRGAIICAVSIGAAALLAYLQGTPWVAAGTVYGDPLLPWIVFSLSFTALISGFESTKLGTASRHLALGKMTLLDLACQLFGLVVTLTWAWWERSVWALVAGSITGSAAKAFLSHRLLPGEPDRLGWRRQHFAEIFHFGKWVFLSSIAGFLLSNADRLLLGGLVGPASLGLYVVAYLIINSLQWAILNLVVTVSFPVLSQAARASQADLPRLYYRLRHPLEAVSFLMAALLFAFGDSLVGFFYDPRYAESGRMLQILALSLATVPYQLSDQLYLALGHSKRLFQLNLFRTLAIYATLPLAYRLFGSAGAVWAIALTPFLSIPVSLYMNHRLGVMAGKREILVALAAIFCLLAIRPFASGI